LDSISQLSASRFARTVETIHRESPRTFVEVLVPDFNGSEDAIAALAQTTPDVLAHNIETVRRLYPRVRPGADYRRSLGLFRRARDVSPGTPLKSGLMLGLGESPDEVEEAMGDLMEAGCRLLTLGQYLQPSRAHLPVERYIPPEEFDAWSERALKMGFAGVASGPLVRSSYRAKELHLKATVRQSPLFSSGENRDLPAGRAC